MKLYVYSKYIKAWTGKIPQWLFLKKKKDRGLKCIYNMGMWILYSLYFSVCLGYFII